MDTAPPDLDELAGDELDEDDDPAEEDEGAGHTRRWVRFVMPVMVEVDCDDDEITSVVTLPSEIRLDRDDMMELCIYDEAFRRRPGDEQPQMHALYLAGPDWPHPTIHGGTPVNWPPPTDWHEDCFPRIADEEAYAGASPYGDGEEDF